MQQLTISKIKESESYVGKPVTVPIEWSVKGKKHEALVNVKLRSYDSVISEASKQNEGEDLTVARILSSVVDEQGAPLFTLKDIVGDENGENKMCGSLFMALAIAINEANGFVAEEESKKEQPPKASGTS